MNGKTNPAPGPGPAPAGRVWTFIRIMNVRLRFIFLMVLVGLVAGYWENITNYYDRWRRPVAVSAGAHAEETEYYCPMHPSVVRDRPGNCPICGMPLSKRAKTGAQTLPEGVLARVRMTPLKVALGRIGTSPVRYELLSREIRTVGIVDYDETRRAFIAARFKGRIEKLHVNFVGQHVEPGDPLVSIYSPDLLVAQGELLSAVRSLESQKGAADVVRQSAQGLVDAARKKLVLWGITREQIDELVRRGTPETTLTIYSPQAGIVTEKKVLEGHYVNEGDDLYTIADLSTVWMQAQVFEDQIAGVKIDTAVEVTSTAFPEEIFAGRITFIAYTVDPATRTVAARVEIANPDYKLKPGMYAHAAIRLPLGKVTPLAADSRPASAPAATAKGDEFEYYCEMHPAVVRAAPGDCPICGMHLTKRAKTPATSAGEERFATGYFCPIYPDRLFDQPQHCPIDKFPTKFVKIEKVLAVPVSAVIDTGTRKIVYRESLPGVFDMVAVQLGPRAGEFYPVLAGLAVQDQVATAGAFLVDAENRLNPAAGAQYFGASGGPQTGAHQH